MSSSSSNNNNNTTFEVGQRVKLVDVTTSRADLVARLGEMAVVTAVHPVGPWKSRTMLSVKFEKDGKVSDPWYAYRFEPVPQTATVDEATLRATFRDGGPNVRAALKKLFPAITFTVTKTVPMTRALGEVSIGQWFKSSFGSVYQRIHGYLWGGSMLVNDTERLYVVNRDGIVDYYLKSSSGDVVVTLTDRDGTPLTEEKDEVC